MKYGIALLGIITLLSCGDDQSTNDAKVQAQLDSMNQQLIALREQLKNKDSASDPIAVVDSNAIPVVPPPPPPPPVPVVDITKDPQFSKQSGDRETALFYYTGNKNKSVEITPWNEGKRTVTLYDPTGKVMYTFHDKRFSYSLTTRIVTFHSNGAVQKAIVHNNPGASNSWSESHITFGSNNEPQWREDIKFPQELTLEGNTKYYWDKNQKNWIKQEVVYEQPVPQPR